MLRLIVGVSRKVGLPNYGSAGASCQIEVELASGLLGQDPQEFRDQVRRAYVAAHQAVDDELAPFQTVPDRARNDRTVRLNGHAGRERRWHATNVTAAGDNGDAARPHRTATANQVRAIVTIARRHRADLEELLRDGYGVGRPEDLSLADASTLIRRLNATADV